MLNKRKYITFAALKDKDMEKQQFNASLRVAKRQVDMALEVYLFQENGVDIAYCPALDVSAAGTSIENAKQEFEQTIAEHIEYCIEQGTFATDLINHGWKLKGRKNNYLAPRTTEMLIGNDTLRDIVDNKDYQKIILPQMFNLHRAYA